MLDDKDKVIMEYLLHDCRFSLKKLSKILRIKEPSLLYRIKNLEEKYILKYDAVLNYSKFYLKFSLLFVQVSEPCKEEFEDVICRCENVETFFETYNKMNYVIWVVFRNEKEEGSFLKNMKKYVKDYNKYCFKDMNFMPYSIFDVNVNLKHNVLNNSKNNNLELDELDVKLLKIMSDGHARDSILSLSSALKVNYHTLFYRFKRLVNSNYFLAFVAQPQINLTQNDIIFFRLKEGIDYNLVKNKLDNERRIPFVISLQDNYFYLQVLTDSLNEYKRVIGNLNMMFREEMVEINYINPKRVLVLNRYPFDFLLRKK